MCPQMWFLGAGPHKLRNWERILPQPLSKSSSFLRTHFALFTFPSKFIQLPEPSHTPKLFYHCDSCDSFPLQVVLCASHFLLIKTYLGLPWWRSGWGSACQCREHRFEPWSGKIPHAAEQLGPWATITEPTRLEPVLRNKRGRDSERSAHHNEEWPPLATTRESPRTETKTQHSHK